MEEKAEGGRQFAEGREKLGGLCKFSFFGVLSVAKSAKINHE